MKTLYIQKRDFKAEMWARSLSCRVIYMNGVNDMLACSLCIKKGDMMIARYMNDVPSALGSVYLLTVVFLCCALVKVKRAKLIWICHNVDRETCEHYRLLTRVKRKYMLRMADTVLVLARQFKRYVKHRDVRVISFGRKEGGSLTESNERLIRTFAKGYDRIVLVASSGNGSKYKSFDRVSELKEAFQSIGSSVGFVFVGKIDSIDHAGNEKDILRVTEANIDEGRIGDIVDFIYRENDDISMPYSVYSAASACIPVLTREGNAIADILYEHQIGGSSNDPLVLSRVFNRKVFRDFLATHGWESLGRVLEVELTG